MNLLDFVRRAAAPGPWSEGDNIPWHEPGFSQRMLREHLSQAHDAASRRFEKIDQHVGWIHHDLLKEQPTKILDLGCGPGLYSSRLAKLGHECLGIDYSPASIAYAVCQAEDEGLNCKYVYQDIRTADYGAGFELAMLIFGEFNVFRPEEAKAILRKAYQALSPGGFLLMEPHTFAAVEMLGQRESTWFSSEGGLFLDAPHLYLQENFWDADLGVMMVRYFIVDAASGEVTRYAQSMQAYTDAQYRDVLTGVGFGNIQFIPSLTGKEDPTARELFVIAAQK